MVIPCGRIAEDKSGEHSRWSGSRGIDRYFSLCLVFPQGWKSSHTHSYCFVHLDQMLDLTL